MTRHWLTALAIGLIICGCRSRPLAAPHLSDEDHIREAVFRYQFDFNASGQGQSANAYYLRLEDDQDPTEQFLQRLEPGTALVVDSQGGLPGLLFWIAAIRWVDDDCAEVDGGYDEVSESAAGSMYYLEKVHGRWEVIDEQMQWIR